MARASIRVWLLLAGMVLGDIIWAAARGLSLSHWGPLTIVGLGLLGLTLYYQASNRSARIAAMAETTLQWVIFSSAGASLTYLVAMHTGPLYDHQFAAADAVLGFDWRTWFVFVNRHEPIKFILALAYSSLMPQILFTIFYLAWRDRDARNAELLTTVIVALALTSAIFYRLPATGPGGDMPFFIKAFVGELLALREGGTTAFDVTQLKGIISFPSFHAALAVLFTYAHRRSWLFLPIAALNTVMLVSIPSEGGHYLVDVFAGLTVAVAAILTVRAGRIVPRIAYGLAGYQAPAGSFEAATRRVLPAKEAPAASPPIFPA
jgi:hypothetical protein